MKKFAILLSLLFIAAGIKSEGDFTGKEITTPSSPDSGYNKIYFKSDDKLYKLTSGGVESEVGSGSETDPVYSANTYATGMNQGVATSNSPTFANVTDSGLTITRIPFASTAGLLVDDSDLSFATDTLTLTKLKTANIFPPSDSTTAIRLFKANASTAVLTVDTSNTRLGIGVTPTVALDVVGAGKFSTTLSSGGAMDSDVIGGQFSIADAGYGASKTAFRFYDDYSYTPGNQSYLHTVLHSKFSLNTSNQHGGGIGVLSDLINAGTGARTSFTGFKSQMNMGGTSATIGDIYQFYASTKAGNQAVTEAYGLYIEAQKGTAVTSGYSIYAAGASDQAYFAHPLSATTLTASNGSVNGSSFLALRAANYNIIYAEPNAIVGANHNYRSKFGRADGDVPNAQVDVVATGVICSGTAPLCSSFSSEETCVWSGCSWSTEIDCTQFSTAETCLYGCSWDGGSPESCSENGYCDQWDQDPGTCVSQGCNSTQTQYFSCSDNGYCGQWNGYSISDCQSNSSSLCTMDNDYETCYAVTACSSLDASGCQGASTYCTYTPDLYDCYYGYCSGYDSGTCQSNYTYCNYSGGSPANCTGTGAGCVGGATACSSLSGEGCVSPCSSTPFPAVKSNNGYQSDCIVDADVPNSSFFCGSEHSDKGCWKDSGGSVHELY
jgi:hypothetical protein